MRRVFGRYGKHFGLIVPVSAILFVIALVLPPLLSGCAGKSYSVVNVYVNISGHDINITSYRKNDEIWVKRLTFSLPDGKSKSLIGEFSKGSYISDVLLYDRVDSVTVDYGQGVQATFKPLVVEPIKRNIYIEKYYEKEISRDKKEEYKTVLTFTFTEQDYLDAQ